MNWNVISLAPRYEVSDSGFIRRGDKILKPYIADGYLKVELWDSGVSKKYLVHRLVAFAFIGEPPTPKHEVAHWNGQKQDNNAFNLRWATRSENSLDKVRHGKSSRGENHPLVKLSTIQVLAIKEALKNDCPSLVSKSLGVSYSCVKSIKYGRAWAWLSCGIM